MDAPPTHPKRFPRGIRLALLMLVLLFLALLGTMRPAPDPVEEKPSANAMPTADPFSVARAERGAWQDLGQGLGRIAWVETRSDPSVEPPRNPGWTVAPGLWDLEWTPGKQPEGGASFGPTGELAAAWYLVQSTRPSLELWHVDKRAVSVTDADGTAREWAGGSGASRLDDGQRLQYVYLLVPRDQAGRGARIHLVLTRFDRPQTRTAPVTLPF